MKIFKTIDEIRAERRAQRGNVVIFNLLGVLLGELDRRPNQNTPVTGVDIYKNIKKLYEAAIECDNKEEEQYLEPFIIKQMTEDELRAAIRGIIDGSGINDIGGIMKCLNKYYPGQYDGKMASVIIREMLT